MKVMQTVTFKSNLEDKAAAREDKAAAMDDTKKAIDDIHKQRTTKAEEEAQAIRDEFGGRFWGTIFGGPLIGTLIGWGIGALASNDNDDAAAAAATKAGLADLDRAGASDDLADANELVDNAKQRESQIEGFMREIRQHDAEHSRD
jgi:hypothetical protein